MRKAVRVRFLGCSREWTARYSPLDQEALNLREKLWSGFSSRRCYYAPPSLDVFFSHQKKSGREFIVRRHRHPRWKLFSIIIFFLLVKYKPVNLELFLLNFAERMDPGYRLYHTAWLYSIPNLSRTQKSVIVLFWEIFFQFSIVSHS